MGYVMSSLRGLFPIYPNISAKKSCKDDTTQTITLVMGNEKMYSSMIENVNKYLDIIKRV